MVVLASPQGVGQVKNGLALLNFYQVLAVLEAI
jgi:hypothetical protein